MKAGPSEAEAAPVLQFRPDAGGAPVDLVKLVSSRLLIQGSSGAGKSWLIRYLLEQTHGRIQQFVFDPEGEFVTLRERFDYVVASASGNGDVLAHPDTAGALCEHLVRLQASAILDIYDLPQWSGEADDELPTREKFVGNFLNRLLSLPKEEWRPALVVSDEAHEFAPQAGRPPSRRAMESLVSKGRKRGLCAVFATQRISKLSKNASDMQNILVGLTGLDTDVKRAGELLGFDRNQREQLKRLEENSGEFFAFGPAIAREVTKVRSGPVQTHHPKAGEVMAPTPPPRGALAELVAQLAAAAAEAEPEGDDTIEGLRAEVARLKAGAPARNGPTEAEIAERIRRAREEGWNAGGLAARAAAREELGPAAATLYHALANGGSPRTEEAVVTPGVKGLPAAAAPRREAAVTAAAPRHQPAAPRAPRGPAPAGALPNAWQRILDAGASLAAVGVKTPSRKNLAVFARMSPKSSAYDGHIAKMVQAGLLEYPGDGLVALTAEGRKQGRATFKPKSVDELHEAWFAYLSDAQTRILRALLRTYPKPLSREALGTAANQSHRSSAFDGHIAELQQLGLVRYPQDRHVAATDLLFPEALR